MNPSLPSAAAFAVLAATLLYLHRQHRQTPFLLWGLAWLVLAVRQLVGPVGETAAGPAMWAEAALVAAAGALVLLGGFALTGPGRLGPLLSAVIGLGIGALTVLVFAALMEIGPAAGGRRAAALATAFLGVGAVGAGWLLDRSGRRFGSGATRIGGAALALWGGVQPIAWGAGIEGSRPGWLTAIDGALAVLLAVCMIAVAIQAAQRRLVARLVDSRDLFDHDPNMILVLQDGRCVFVNRALRERSGLDLVGVTAEELLDRLAPEHREAAAGRLAARMRGEVVADYEADFLDVRGERVPVILHANPLTWEGRPALRYVLTDITRRRQAEQEIQAINTELQRINAELEKSSQLKSEFLSNTSHELKTPLTSIIANTEILEYEMCGPVNEEQRRVLANISRNSQHLLDMISRLLDFARHEEGRAAVRYEQVDLRTLLDGVVETVRPLLDDVARRIEVHVDGGLDRCYLDGEKIYRVYLNLVENAIKFSRDGVIRLEAERVGQEIEGRVADQGIGIPPEKLDEIFDAFRQVDASSTRTYQGVGLGLAICKQLIELHGGRIWAESAPGAGSVFRFRIPYLTEMPGGALAVRPRPGAAVQVRP